MSAWRLASAASATGTLVVEVGTIEVVATSVALVVESFDTGTVYVAFDNHRWGDFKPYLYASTDGGKDFIGTKARPFGQGG